MKKLMAANWKLFKTVGEATQAAAELAVLVSDKMPEDREALIIPPFTALRAVKGTLSGAEGIHLGGQNFYPEEEGAFTGEISPAMLLDCGCTYALAGHSERRHVMGEDDAMVGRKVTFGLQKGLNMILCIGERIHERKSGRVEGVLRNQLEIALADVDKTTAPDSLVVAYEPVWAIGTGEVAGPEEIVHAHAFVRSVLDNIFPGRGSEIPIQYGGSVKPANCSEIISLDNVDGVLVGGASLLPESFFQIVLA